MQARLWCWDCCPSQRVIRPVPVLIASGRITLTSLPWPGRSSFLVMNLRPTASYGGLRNLRNRHSPNRVASSRSSFDRCFRPHLTWTALDRCAKANWPLECCTNQRKWPHRGTLLKKASKRWRPSFNKVIQPRASISLHLITFLLKGFMEILYIYIYRYIEVSGIIFGSHGKYIYGMLGMLSGRNRREYVVEKKYTGTNTMTDINY